MPRVAKVETGMPGMPSTRRTLPLPPMAPTVPAVTWAMASGVLRVTLTAYSESIGTWAATSGMPACMGGLGQVHGRLRGDGGVDDDVGLEREGLVELLELQGNVRRVVRGEFADDLDALGLQGLADRLRHGGDEGAGRRHAHDGRSETVSLLRLEVGPRRLPDLVRVKVVARGDFLGETGQQSTGILGRARGHGPAGPRCGGGRRRGSGSAGGGGLRRCRCRTAAQDEGAGPQDRGAKRGETWERGASSSWSISLPSETIRIVWN